MSRKFFLIGFFLSFLGFLIYILSFYPGILTADSWDQWSQMRSFTFSDIHPVFHTLIIYLVTRFWTDPAAVIIFQSIIFSLVLSYTFTFFYRLGLNKFFLLFSIFFISINPLFGMMVVTLWKDVLFAIDFLFLGTLVLEMNLYGVKIFKRSKIKVVLFLISLISLSMIRQNGLLTFVVLFLFLLICFWKYKFFIFNSFVTVFLIVALIKGPIYSYLRVSPSPKSQFFYQPVLFFSNIVHKNLALTDYQYSVINGLMKYDLWEKYYSPITSWNYFVSGYFNSSFLVEKEKDVLTVFCQLLFKYPDVFLRSWFNLNSYILTINRPVNYYIMPMPVEMTRLENDKYYGSLSKSDHIYPRYILPTLRDKIIFYIIRFNASKYFFVLFQPAVYLYLNIIILFFLIFFKRNWIVLLPAIVNVVSMFISGGSQELRYVYPLMTSSILTLLLFVFEFKSIFFAKSR